MDSQDKNSVSVSILSSLISGDKYGYEIIDFSQKSGFTLKQPTMYTALKRLEEQSCISSYWRDSEIGGRRHYYRITDYGKKQLESYATSPSLGQNSIPFKKEQVQLKQKTNMLQTNIFETKISNSFSPADFNDENNDLNDISLCSENTFDNIAKAEKVIKNDAIFLPQEESNISSKNGKLEAKKALDTINTSNQNMQVNNISNDFDVFSCLSNYKKDSSFCSQLALAAKPNITIENDLTNTQTLEEKDKSKNLSNFSFENNEIGISSNKFDCIDPNETNTAKPTFIPDNKSKIESSDAKLITQRVETKDLVSERTSGIKNSVPIVETESVKKIINNPSPLSNTYSSKLNNLYNTATNQDEDNSIINEVYSPSISNIKVEFYKKINNNKSVSIYNKFYFHIVTFMLLFIMSALLSSITYLIISSTASIPSDLIWLYFMPSVLVTLYYSFILIIKSKRKYEMSYKKENNTTSLFLKLIIFITLCLIAYAINVCCGLNNSNIKIYATTLFLPISALMLIPLSSLSQSLAKSFKFINK